MGSKPKVALVTGAGGQDGSYLVELLLSKGYQVHALVRSPESISRRWYASVYEAVHLHYGSVTDAGFVRSAICETSPDEIYNLAGQSHIGMSWEEPIHTCETNSLGIMHILEAVRSSHLQPKPRIFQAGTSELFGGSTAARQNESVPFAPTSPYASSKAMAHYLAANYRKRYGLFVVNGILFNHESPRRGETFRTYKITQQIAEVATKKRNFITIGNPETRRDWGHVKDFVIAMWLSLQRDIPDDYVFGTGTSHSLRDFVNTSFHFVNIRLRWCKSGLQEVAEDVETGKVVVRIDKEEYNHQSHNTEADPVKLRKALGWAPEIRFEDMVWEMTEAALRRCS